MELRAVEIAARGNGGELPSVIGRGEGVGTDRQREAVHEVGVVAVLQAVEQGMRTLRQDGIRNVLDGYTTVDEVLKYT